MMASSLEPHQSGPVKKVHGRRSWTSVCGLIGFAMAWLSLVASPVHAFTPPSFKEMPKSIQAFGKEMALSDLKNPLRQDPKKLKENIRAGGRIYYKKCFLCHGDLLDGKGVFGDSFFPPPADLTQPESILSKPESYTFWRIAKGGKGLPEDFAPWNSAMPAWEAELNEQEIWQVILFIYTTADDMDRVPQNLEATEPSLARGEALYKEKCIYCHGETGKGDGPSADYSSPRPRNFYKGQYKIRTTPFGKIPTDQDLFDMLSRPYPGTSMPSWKHLSTSDRWSLVQYLKTLSKKFQKFIDRKKSHQVIEALEPPEFTLETLDMGKQLFMQSCSGCHGVKGRSDGESTHKVVDLDSDSIWPRNLSQPWYFRRGHSLKDIFLTMRTGLSTTAMPRFSSRTFKDDQIWALAHYVQTLALSEKPAVKRSISVTRVEGKLPDSPGDSLWSQLDTYTIPLGGQVIEKPKAYFPTVKYVALKAMHNGDEIAICIHWDDPHVDPILEKHASVQVSPPPPLPPHLQMEEGDEEVPPEPEAQEYPDEIGIQFPTIATANGKRPYFLNGDPANPVNVWKWSTHPMMAFEMNARGMKDWSDQPKQSQGLKAEAMYRYGRYFLVMKRKLKTDDEKNDVQFNPGQPLPFAINVWDGSQKEYGSKKAISSWFEMTLQ